MRQESVRDEADEHLTRGLAYINLDMVIAHYNGVSLAGGRDSPLT
jgi:hypothetical protein